MTESFRIERRRRIAVVATAFAFVGGLMTLAFAPARVSVAQSNDVTYADIAPILKDRCVVCHGGASPAVGLRLDSFDGVRAGGSKGPVAKSGDAAGSELVRRLKGESTPRMPMTGPPFLSDAEIALFERWIAAGMPAGPSAAASATVPQPATRIAGRAVTYADVAPIFATRCAKCHTDNGLMGAPPEGFRLTTYEATISTGDRVRIVPGHPLASLLYRSIRGLARPRMPRDGPPFLADDEIGLIERWIRDGARDAAGTPAPNPAGARIRLDGTLDGRWSLDGLPLRVSAGTRIDKSPGVGDRVEVRGAVRADGTIEVERIRRR